MTEASAARVSTLWIMLLTLASTGTTLAFACATPFPALAALAAAHMRRSDALWLMLACWAASQAVGFGLLGYPHDAGTLARGLAVGVAAMAGALTAHRFAGAGALPARLASGFAAAFVGFKAALLLASVGVAGLDGAFLPHVLAKQVMREGIILAALACLYRGLVAAGVPAPRRVIA